MRTIKDEFRKLERQYFVKIQRTRLTRKVVIYGVFDMHLRTWHTAVFSLEEIGKQKDAIGYLLKYIEPLCGVCEYDRKCDIHGVKYMDDIQTDNTIDYGDEYE